MNQSTVLNCKHHLGGRQLSAKNFTTHYNVSHKSGGFHVTIHRYNSEVKTDHYHGNLMYDLFYTWPLDTWEYQKTDDITQTIFITLLIITVVGEFIASPSETFADVYTLQTLANKDRDKFGLQLIPGLVGWLTISISFAVATNLNVDLKDDLCHMGHVINFSSYMYVFYAMIFICMLVALTFKYNEKIAHGEELPRCGQCNLFAALPVLAKTPAYAAFAFVVVFCGIGAGVKQLYIYHYVSELGGSLVMLPIVTVVHFLSNLCALLLSPMLLQKYGSVKIIYTGLLANAVTFVVYAVMEKPGLVFLVETF